MVVQSGPHLQSRSNSLRKPSGGRGGNRRTTLDPSRRSDSMVRRNRAGPGSCQNDIDPRSDGVPVGGQLQDAVHGAVHLPDVLLVQRDQMELLGDPERGVERIVAQLAGGQIAQLAER